MSKRYTPPEFAAALGRVRDEVRKKGLSDGAMAGGLVVETHAKLNVRRTFKQRTGLLANSINTRLVSSTPSRAVSETGPSAIYGRIQELGGTVVPVKAKMLHWVDENGMQHAAFSVTLPARPYMEPAVTEHEEEIFKAMSTTLKNTIEGAL